MGKNKHLKIAILSLLALGLVSCQPATAESTSTSSEDTATSTDDSTETSGNASTSTETTPEITQSMFEDLAEGVSLSGSQLYKFHMSEDSGFTYGCAFITSQATGEGFSVSESTGSLDEYEEEPTALAFSDLDNVTDKYVASDSSTLYNYVPSATDKDDSGNGYLAINTLDFANNFSSTTYADANDTKYVYKDSGMDPSFLADFDISRLTLAEEDEVELEDGEAAYLLDLSESTDEADTAFAAQLTNLLVGSPMNLASTQFYFLTDGKQITGIKSMYQLKVQTSEESSISVLTLYLNMRVTDYGSDVKANIVTEALTGTPDADLTAAIEEIKTGNYTETGTYSTGKYDYPEIKYTVAQATATKKESLSQLTTASGTYSTDSTIYMIDQEAGTQTEVVKLGDKGYYAQPTSTAFTLAYPTVSPLFFTKTADNTYEFDAADYSTIALGIL